MSKEMTRKKITKGFMMVFSENENGSCRINDPALGDGRHDIIWIIDNCKSIAVVGLSPNPSRPSYQVSAYLKEKGYRIMPVYPAVTSVLGEKAYSCLEDIDDKIDLVLVFRKSEAVGTIVDEAIKKTAEAVWMQEGIVNGKAAQKARAAGLRVVMDRCMSKEVYKYR